jgi:hypothetical protein
MRWFVSLFRILRLCCGDARLWLVERIMVRGLRALRQEHAPSNGLQKLLLALGLKRSA